MVDTAPDQRPVPTPTDGLVDLDVYEAHDPVVHRSRAMTPLTWGLLFVLTAVGGFVAGAKVQGTRTTTTTTATGGTGAAARGAAAAGASTTVAGRAGQAAGATGSTVPGGAAAQGSGRNGGVPAGATVGQVKLVDGANLYVQDTQGDIVKVVTPPGLAVAVSKPGTIADLKPGDTVIVLGDTNADGTVNATSVRTGGLGGGGGGGAFGGGGSRNGGGSASSVPGG